MLVIGVHEGDYEYDSLVVVVVKPKYFLKLFQCGLRPSARAKRRERGNLVIRINRTTEKYSLMKRRSVRGAWRGGGLILSRMAV